MDAAVRRPIRIEENLIVSIRELLNAVLGGYVEAKSAPFADHALANLIRTDLATEIRKSLPTDNTLLLVKGSAGQGVWARGPWVAIFDRLVTDSAQKGFYPVYLFAEDMRGVYLSLNQAMTEAKSRYKSDAKTSLRARAGNFRAMLGPNLAPFNTNPIDLSPSASSNDTAFYEAGNICSAYYPKNAIPPETDLVQDLERMLSLYQTLVEMGAGDEQIEQQEPEQFLEGSGPARAHLRIERNRKLISRVKECKGYRCEICDLQFSEKYGDMGKGYIEAHHLVPFAKLKGNAIPLDPKKDFAVLCANCHRMAHKLDDVADMQKLRSIYQGIDP